MGDYEFEDYATNLYSKGKVLCGSFFEHINDAWKNCGHPNFKFLWYEDMIEDMPKMIKEIAEFANVQLSEDQVKKLAEHCNFKNFKENSTVNGKSYLPAKNGSFIRKGQVGDWKNHFKNQDRLKEFED